ncbi:MAG TPA: L-threonylcarbamoyladenylate synthase [Flavitalea sp.]|nr:L-threonylcarbamoyladenylate synthase [Flavitalea sp.]
MLTTFNHDIEQCVEILKKGGLILYPTDTVWGIGCDATNPTAATKIYSLKKRVETKAMIVLVADPKDLLKYTASPDLSIIDHLATKQKPTTVIYEGAIGLAPNIIAPDGTIAMRITKDDFCRHLIKRFRKPIVSTSANFSGYPTPPTFDKIDTEIKNAVDYVVHYRRDDNRESVPSTVIMWKNGRETIIRP